LEHQFESGRSDLLAFAFEHNHHAMLTMFGDEKKDAISD